MIILTIETYSDIELSNTSSHRYAEDNSTEVVLVTWQHGQDGQVWQEALRRSRHDFALDLPTPIIDAAQAGEVFVAYDTDFTPAIFADLGLVRPVWRSIAAAGHLAGIPTELLTAAQAKVYKRLIKQFCMPQAKKVVRVFPDDDPQAFASLGDMAKAKLHTLAMLAGRLGPFLDAESETLKLHRHINAKGFRIDQHLAESAIGLNAAIKAQAQSDLDALIGVKGAKPAQVAAFVSTITGTRTISVSKTAFTSLLAQHPHNPKLAEIAQAMGVVNSTAASKFTSATSYASLDGRLRDGYVYAGALTHAWAGQGFNPLNISTGTADASHESIVFYKDIVSILGADALETVRIFYEDGFLSNMLRAMIVPADGHQFVISDFRQIQSRILSALAGEQWRCDAFTAGRDIYAEAADRMGVSRNVGKVAELALGFGGGHNALRPFAAKLEHHDAKELVAAWRTANPNIVRFWERLENAWTGAVGAQMPTNVGSVKFIPTNSHLFIAVPTYTPDTAIIWPKIAYLRPDANLSYEGRSIAGWGRQQVHGAILAQNICAKIARDYLVRLMHEQCKDVVMHTHDETVADIPTAAIDAHVDALAALSYEFMGIPLPLSVKVSDYFTK